MCVTVSHWNRDCHCSHFQLRQQRHSVAKQLASALEDLVPPWVGRFRLSSLKGLELLLLVLFLVERQTCKKAAKTNQGVERSGAEWRVWTDGSPQLRVDRTSTESDSHRESPHVCQCEEKRQCLRACLRLGRVDDEDQAPTDASLVFFMDSPWSGTKRDIFGYLRS